MHYMNNKTETNDLLQQNYSRVAIFLHWLIALMVMMNIVGGLLFSCDIILFSNQMLLHKQSGVIILVLVIVRIIWRLSHEYPRLTGSIPASEEVLAKFGQFLLYFLMLTVPLSGLIFVQSAGHNPTIAGYHLPILMPFLTASDVPQLELVHTSLAVFFATLILGHTIAALKHHFIDKKRVLVRILPKFLRRE